MTTKSVKNETEFEALIAKIYMLPHLPIKRHRQADTRERRTVSVIEHVATCPALRVTVSQQNYVYVRQILSMFFLLFAAFLAQRKCADVVGSWHCDACRNHRSSAAVHRVCTRLRIIVSATGSKEGIRYCSSFNLPANSILRDGKLDAGAIFQALLNSALVNV